MFKSFYVRHYVGMSGIMFCGLITYVLQKRDSELMTIYRDKSALFGKELRPGEPPSWPQWPRWLAWASRSDNPKLIS